MHRITAVSLVVGVLVVFASGCSGEELAEHRVGEELSLVRRVVGTVVAQVQEDRSGASTREYWIVVGGNRYQLVGWPGEGLVSGSTIEVTGVLEDSRITVERLQVVVQPPPAHTLGEQPTLVILAQIVGRLSNAVRGAPLPLTREEATEMVFGAEDSVDAFYRRSSYGQTSLAGDVTGWHVVDLPACGMLAMLHAAMRQVRRDNPAIRFNRYRRFVLLFPTASCPGWGSGGAGTIGETTIITPDGPVVGSVAWVKAEWGTQAIAHELGHGLGLDHADELECGPVAVRRTECVDHDYGDPLDTMALASGDFNAAHKHALRWLGPSEVATIEEPGTHVVELRALETQTDGVRAIRVRNGEQDPGRDRWYYIEYRSQSRDGQEDAEAPRIVQVRRATAHPGSRTYLADLQPESRPFGDAEDAFLAPGASFATPTGIRIRARNASEEAITVEVTLPPPADLVATIVAPSRDTSVAPEDRSTLDITGEASGSDFETYELFVAPGFVAPESGWQSLTGVRRFPAVDNGVLFRWPILDLPLGPYVLRLISSGNGQAREDTTRVALGRPETALTTARIDEESPRVSGDVVVWTAARGIEMRDLRSAERDRVADPPAILSSPEVDGRLLAWFRSASGASSVHACRFAVRCAPRIVSRPADPIVTSCRPVVDANRIVWSVAGDAPHIVLYDWATGSERHFRTPGAACPVLDGQTLIAAVQSPDFPGFELLSFDLTRGDTAPVVLARSDVRGDDFTLSGDLVAYTRWVEPGAPEIAVLDAHTGGRLSMPRLVGRQPAVFGRSLVWVDLRWDYDLYHYDLSGNVETRLTYHPSSSAAPDVSGRRLVWTDYRSGDWNVFTMQLPQD